MKYQGTTYLDEAERKNFDVEVEAFDEEEAAEKIAEKSDDASADYPDEQSVWIQIDGKAVEFIVTTEAVRLYHAGRKEAKA